ncbi:PAK3 kinase, partial [Leptocoma aspasia]|nr:PAK3 kinase [Leptocoma aspasia]
VAIKKITLQGLIRKEITFNELMFMKINKNQNVVNYLESYLVDKQLWLVMEYMDGGTLTDIINETHMSEREMAAVSRECLQGLDFLHSNHMIHLDVKSRNILLRTDGSVKLGHCGGIRVWVFCWFRKVIHLCVSAGTEIAAAEWSLNNELWESSYRCERRAGASCFLFLQPQLLITTRGIPKLQQPNLFSPWLHHFLCCCLQTDAARRWSAKELLQHPFVTFAEPVSSLVPLIVSVKKRKETR